MGGKYILFEGIDGCGKSTQIQLFKEYLSSINYPEKEVILIREPGGGILAEKIRSILLDKKNLFITPKAELLLFQAARSQYFEESIYNWLNEGKLLLADRNYYSSIAYQGFGRGMDISTIKNMNEFATNNFKPNVSLIFDLPVELSLTRTGKQNGKDRFESEGESFFNKVRNGYLNMHTIYPDHNIHIIDSNRDKLEVAQDVQNILKKYIL